MRQVVLDTETTGISPESGHRVIEIGCVELINRRLTGRHFQVYINPEREVDAGAYKVHGISSEFLQDKPLFKSILNELIDFISGAEVIIHNAPFDLGFLNSELRRVKWKNGFEDHCSIFDTLVYAREKHPGLRNNLDALCKRYDVNNTNRELHGALLDAEILAYVYLAMTGGQGQLFEDEGVLETQRTSNASHSVLKSDSLVQFASAAELERHDTFVQYIQSVSRK